MHRLLPYHHLHIHRKETVCFDREFELSLSLMTWDRITESTVSTKFGVSLIRESRIVCLFNTSSHANYCFTNDEYANRDEDKEFF